MNKFLTAAATFVIAMAILIALSALLALPVMWLWNGVLVNVFVSVMPVSWAQAWGLNILASILFKSSYTSKS